MHHVLKNKDEHVSGIPTLPKERRDAFQKQDHFSKAHDPSEQQGNNSNLLVGQSAWKTCIGFKQHQKVSYSFGDGSVGNVLARQA